ncbi:MAG TPA: alpha-glucan family phosphorylase, partial [Candidatus Binatia bacterium]|nr:alpha-glucan family phosphorylase [Candidatus Binatia bacterium]
MYGPGASDLRRAAEQLASRLPAPLAPLARLAFNYRWSWTPGGEDLFAAIDSHRWQLCQRNPVRLLQEAATPSLERAAGDRELIRRSQQLEREVLSAPAPSADGEPSAERPAVFFCAEYGVHPSLPIYAGGLGVLAGDLLKEASDRGFPMVAVGLLYRKGYFRQRIDTSGWQHEYWVDTDPERLPAALVTRDGSEPLTVLVPIGDREVVIQVWRVDVGRIPLYLLDADRPENPTIDRWITAQLYVGDREIRAMQYVMLGLGGVRAIRAMGIEPGMIHLNEGHAALAPLELAAADVAAGRSFEQALASAKQRTVFTTHTPVSAGNEVYRRDEITRVCPHLPRLLATDWETLLGLGRAERANAGESPNLTRLAMRLSRSTNGVSRRHGEIARSMWAHAFPERAASAVPIGHVTNGVHLPTWMASEMRELLDRHLGAGWSERATDPATWEPLEQISDADLWATRRRLRARLVADARERA